MTEFVALISALAWPLTVVWLAITFRAEIRKLALRVSRLKYKDLEASFEKDLKVAEVRAKEVTQEKPTPLPGPELSTSLDQLQRIANVSPRAAILEAWLLIETAAGRAGFVQGASMPRVNAPLFIDAMVKKGKLPPNSVALVQQMRLLRNQAAHLSEWEITATEAERYLKLAAQIASLIEEP